MNKDSLFTIYRSAAGSGKTYTLVKEYIKIALTPDKSHFDPNYFKHILAVTFTNKAAAEMKSRVFDFLSELKYGKGEFDQNSFFSHIKNETNLSSEQIKIRSSQLLEAILHAYYNFSISTIDKFVYRIVRTFAHDLNLTQNFEVELDSKNMIQQTIASLIDRIGLDQKLSEALIEFTYKKVDDGNSYNIERDLESFSAFLFNEQTEKYVEKLKKISIDDCLDLKNELQKNIRQFEFELTKFSDDFLLFCKQKKIDGTAFYKKGFYNYFFNLKKLDLKKILPGKELTNSMELERWYAKTSDPSTKVIIDENVVFLKKMYNDLQFFLKQHFKSHVFNKLFVKNIYSVAVFNEINKELNTFKKNNNIQHISEFNNSISNIVRNEPAPFIYERLGDKYLHFLIDEFQDTSVKQWQNLLPLLNNSLSLGKRNLIVGDAKQSIYRWRGGEVEQFIQLPNQIYQKDFLPNSDEILDAIQRNVKQEFLKYNWRSSYEIVDFNNRFFEKVKNLISDDYKNIYHSHDQIPMGKKDGLVQVDYTPFDSKLSKQIIIDKVVNKIYKLKTFDYDYSDIAILCRTKKDSLIVAKKMSELGVPVISDEALLLKNSSEVRFLISLLKFLNNKEDKIAKTAIVQYLSKSQKNEIKHQLFKLVSSKKMDLFDAFLNKSSKNLNISHLLTLSLYDLVEELMSSFQLNTLNIYLQFFLDVVLKFSHKFSNNVSEFLDWWEENNHKESIVVSEQSNAVKIMTIHKSKGLEFPIVFLPFNWKIAKPSSELWVDADYDSSDLNVALLDNSALLEHSNYSDVRSLENNLALLDDINVLYVAMTRPKSQLYIFLEESRGNSNSYNTLSKLFDYFFNDMNPNFPYVEGSLKRKEIQNDCQINSTYNLSYKSNVNWRSIVRLKNSSNQLWDVDQDKKEFGTQLHLWLSKIHYLIDVEGVLSTLKKSNLVSPILKISLIDRIEKIFKNDLIKSFFDEKWSVKTETEILLKDGDVYVPDRVIFNNNKLVVIDYKTGSISNMDKHKSQLINYASILKQMGYDNIKLILIYTEDNLKIIEI